jgi:hypothetical protein
VSLPLKSVPPARFESTPPGSAARTEPAGTASGGRSETDEASWGTAVGPPLYTAHWGLLKQPDNQKIACFSVFVPNSGLPQILEAPISRLIVLAAEVLDPRAMA